MREVIDSIEAGPDPVDLILSYFPGVEMIDQHYFNLSGYGLFYIEHFPWIYHQTLGFVYVEGSHGSGTLLYGPSIGWYYLSTEASYPYLYLFETNTWAFLDASGNIVPVE